jgi:hypothetical protein
MSRCRTPFASTVIVTFEPAGAGELAFAGVASSAGVEVAGAA